MDGRGSDTVTAEVRTFLLADLRGYTRYTVQHGDAAAAALAARFEAVARDVVAAHGGSVFGTAGDQVLAVFTSARRALTAALALQSALHASGSGDNGGAIEAGAGLDAGEAIPVGDDYRGSAVNLAARLCSLAAGGEVLASEAVVHLAGTVPGLRYLERGAVQVKGFADAVRVVAVVPPDHDDGAAWSELGADAAERPEQALPIGGFLGALPSTTMVGRIDELERVEHAIAAVRGGAGRLVMLVGEPGVGKTRLAQEVTLRLRDSDFLIAAGRCYEPRQAVGFYSFLEALATLYASAPPAMQREVPRRWPYLARLLPEQNLPVPPSSDGHEEQERLFRTVGGFISAIAEQQPVAIMLDDLHWADSASLELLQHLARHTRRSRVLLLGTYRDVEVQRQHLLSKALRDLQREELVERIPVRRLSEGDTAALIGATIGDERVSTELAQLVHRSTEGNPFFTHEVMRALIERGDLYQEDGRWRRREIDDIVVPESVRDTIGERLSRLRAETQEILYAASVLGQTFNFDELQRIGDFDEAELEASLEESIAAGLVHEMGGDAYSFDHALTQATLYGELSARRRRKLHVAAGEALEGMPERKRRGRLSELAWHFVQGGDDERALRYSLEAGDAAETIYAHAEAAHHYRAAVELAAELESEREAEAREKLGVVLTTRTMYAAAEWELERAVRLYRDAHDREAETRTMAHLGWLDQYRETFLEGATRLRTYLDRVDGAGQATPSPALARAYVVVAHLLLNLGEPDNDGALAASERAMELARSLGDDRLLAAAGVRRAIALLPNRPAEAQALLREMQTLAETTGELEALERSLHFLSVANQALGDHSTVRPYHERAIAIAESIGDLHRIERYGGYLAEEAARAGDFPQAYDDLDRAISTLRRFGAPRLCAVLLATKALFLAWQGQFDAAAPLLDEAAPLATRTVDFHLIDLVRAYSAVFQEHPEAAIPHLEGIIALPDPDKFVLCEALALLADLTFENGDRAEQLAQRALAQADRIVSFLQAYPLRALANLDARREEWEEAAQRFEEALATFDAWPNVPIQGWILLDYGLMLREKGERDAASAKLEAARALFERIEARPFLARTEKALAQLRQ